MINAMRPRPFAVMATIYISVQVAAILLAPLFLQGVGEPPNPNDPLNPIIYMLLIIAMTGFILLLFKYKWKGMIQGIFYASIFITILYVFIPLLLEMEGALGLNSGGWFPLLGALGLAAGLMYALMKYREWYVINLIGLIVAIGITAILGMSLGILSSIILLIIMAAYDAIAVYKTKHMITLAEGVAQMRLPILFVVPKSRDFTMDRLDETGITQSEGGEREAFFMGVGDTVIPGILAVSASLYLPNTASFLLTANLWAAIGAIIGGLMGYLLLLRFVLRGKPQAGLPFLNSGAILGYLLAYAMVYQNLNLHAFGL